jgi:hypothetical protein
MHAHISLYTIHTYTCVCVCVYTHTRTHTYERMYVCTYVGMYGGLRVNGAVKAFPQPAARESPDLQNTEVCIEVFQTENISSERRQ